MAERIIRMLGDPVLREKCKPVESTAAPIHKLLDDLTTTLYATDGRAGLAAPQIGIPKRLVVLDCGSGLIELINPEIVAREGEQVGLEACLSIPGVHGKVRRAASVVVQTLDRAGNQVFVSGEGYLAVCLQHEIDHLDGILYLDHLQPGNLFEDATHKAVDVLEMIRRSHGQGNRMKAPTK